MPTDSGHFSGTTTCFPWWRPSGPWVWRTSASSLCLFVRFFDNHGLLNLVDRPQWYTLKAVRSYIPPITARYRDRLRPVPLR